MSLQIQLKKSAVSQKQPFASDLAVGELALNYNADGPFLTCKDTAGNVRKLNNVWVGATAPTSPSAGDQWLDTSAATAVLKVYKDSSSTWVNATTIPLATTSVYGTVRLATAADVTNGTTGKVVDAAQLASRVTADIATALAADPFIVPNLSVTGNATVTGNLTVDGTQTIINTQTLDVEDRNIVLGNVSSPTDATANTGGFTLKGSTDKTFSWLDATDSWTSSENVDLASGKSYRINGTEVLSGTALGSGITVSSLTSVGTIGTGTWEGTAIGTGYGGTGQSVYADGELLIGKTDGSLAKATLTAGSNVSITNGDGAITIASTDTTYTAGDGLDLTGTEFSADLKANGGVVIETGELAIDLGASSITGTLAVSDGGTGQTTFTDGQLLIGKTDGTLAKATITAGSGISVANGDGAITITNSATPVTSVTATTPLASTGGVTPDISIQDATTSQKGAVQLSTATDSTSTTLAATPSAVKAAYDLAASASAGLFTSYAIISDTKAQSTHGGTFTSGAWQTRDLNTENADPDGIVSIASNQFTLNAGSYLIKWSAPAYDTGKNQTRLSDGSNFYYGTPVDANATYGGFSVSHGSARITIASSTAFTIEHQSQLTRSTDGFGLAGNFAIEVYTIVEIYKEA